MMNPNLPSGTVTFLFTDIQGSTKMLQRLGEGYTRVLADHEKIIRNATAAHNGYVVDSQGDAFFLAFGRALDAVYAAVDIQRMLASHDWPEGENLLVRMGLHTGQPVLANSRYVGMDVHRAARISGVAHGGQVLLSEATYALVNKDLGAEIDLKDMGRHNLKDLPTAWQLYQLEIPGLPSDFPPLQTLDYFPTNLPSQVNTFIGRTQELALIKDRLKTNRLVTLTGSGGVGKTRIAQQAGREILPTYPDGVWLVELAPLTDPTLLPQTVSTTLHIQSESGRPILAILIDHLQPKTTLLILDNCEHMIDASAQLTEQILAHCPNVHICVTSREALGIQGENAIRVPSLALPPTGESTVETLGEFETVQLFLDRAAAALPGFTLNESNAPIIAQVCRRLDGIPLAIELAASRINLLRVEQIAARLDDAFRLLTGGSRTALPRQQTLRATIDWSHDLLSESERALFRRLSVFAGGWTLESAEAICALEEQAGDGRAPAFDSGDVLDLLAYIVDKSLVLVQREQGVGARYYLLETIRQYAREKLRESGEGEVQRGRHLDHFLQLAEMAEIELHRPDQKQWLARLEEEHDNFRAALEWAIATQPEMALRLGAGLAEFWDARGYFTEGRQWLIRVLAAAQELPPSPAYIKILSASAGLDVRQGDIEQFQAHLEQGLAFARQIEDQRGIAQLLMGSGILMEYCNQKPEEADALYTDSLRLYRELGDQLGIGQALGPLAGRAKSHGDYSEAERLFNESLQLFRELGDLREIAGALWNLAETALAQADYSRAEALTNEALALYRELDDRHGIATTLRTLGQAITPQAESARLAALYSESCRLFRELGDRGCLAISLVTGGRALLAANEIHLAQEMIWQALALAKEIIERQSIGSVLEGAAGVALEMSHWQESARLFGAAEAARESILGSLTKREQDAHDHAVTSLCTHLDDESFARNWVEGKKLTAEQAIEYALSLELF